MEQGRKPVIGIIGLGLMGSGYAAHLRAQGYEVVGYDVQREALQAVSSRLGVKPAGSPREVATLSDLILLSLPTLDVVTQVLEGPDGVLEAESVPDTIIDTTTGEPFGARAIAARLAERGISYLDATVGGNSDQLRKRDVLMMVGGDEKAFRQWLPVLNAITDTVFYMGPSGAGSAAKLVFNLVQGLHRAVLAEALTLSEKAGIDPRRMLEVMKAGSAYSRMMDIKGERMLTRNYTPAGKMKWSFKDTRLILELGERVGAPLPLAEVNNRLMRRGVEEEGLAEWDNAAIYEVYQKMSKAGAR